MGDWYLGNDYRWHYQADAPSPDPTVTQIGAIPPVPPDSSAPPNPPPRADDWCENRVPGEITNQDGAE